MFETLLLGFLILLLGGSSIVMSRRTKNNNSPTVVSSNLDIEALVSAISKSVAQETAKAMAEQLKEVLKDLPAGGRVTHRQIGEVSETTISMDESIIPMNVSNEILSSNLDGMAKEEMKVDKDMKKSKSSLANLMKNKKK